MFSLPRSCCYRQQVEDRHTILPLMRKEEKIKGSERKRSLLEEISTLKEKRRLETLSGAQHLSCMRRHKIPYQAKKKTHFISLFHPLHHCQHHSYHHHHQRRHHLHIQQIGCLHLLHGISCELNGRYMPAVVLYFYQHSQTPSG